MSKKSKKESTLYYFYSVGCAFCKYVEPIVDKLNSDGYNIIKLDLSDKSNQLFKKEIEDKFKIVCGTPLLVDSDTGNAFCGWRDEETIKKWANGEKIPEPPKPKSKPPQMPKDMFDDKQVDKFKKEYDKWAKENNHLPELKTSDEVVNRIRKDVKRREMQQNSLIGRLTTLEQKIDKLMNHLGVK